MALLSNFKVSDKYDCIPPIKYMNSLRNKLSHNIEFKIGTEDLLPLTQYLTKVFEDKAEVPKEPKAILEHFTTMSCVLFAASISEHARLMKPTPRRHSKGTDQPLQSVDHISIRKDPS